MNERTFCNEVAVNAQQGDRGNKAFPLADTFRCHRGRLEALLRARLFIKWGKRLKTIQFEEQAREITASFDDERSLKTKCLVGCDGSHSMIRQGLCMATKLRVLPYVVFNGIRRISKFEYINNIRKYIQDNVLIETRRGNVRLEISVSDFADSHVDLSYIYSRPARQSGPSSEGDPLHAPDRSNAGATNIPEEFFEELAVLRDLEPPFNMIFDPHNVRKDRLLHWLMRSVRPDLNELEQLANRGVLLVGDAVHATPILGGEGANMAIKDGIELAEYMAAKGVDNLAGFAESRYESWTEAVKESERKLEEMHVPKVSHL
ncbi:MAG: hypothetical protein M1821_008961 [Bathelium mastoideum]|nr:MAG: hypothetical protein M1821_008961 [Bathelium mastoideum]